MNIKDHIHLEWRKLERELQIIYKMLDELNGFVKETEGEIRHTTVYILLEKRSNEIAKLQRTLDQWLQKLG